LALDEFSERWDGETPSDQRSTTNAIESINSVIHKAIKKRKLFPTDDSGKKVVYLAVQEASKKWTMPIRNWKTALNRFMIEFEDRLAKYVYNGSYTKLFTGSSRETFNPELLKHGI
jgi:transposase-like protein